MTSRRGGWESDGDGKTISTKFNFVFFYAPDRCNSIQDNSNILYAYERRHPHPSPASQPTTNESIFQLINFQSIWLRRCVVEKIFISSSFALKFVFAQSTFFSFYLVKNCWMIFLSLFAKLNTERFKWIKLRWFTVGSNVSRGCCYERRWGRWHHRAHITSHTAEIETSSLTSGAHNKTNLGMFCRLIFRAAVIAEMLATWQPIQLKLISSTCAVAKGSPNLNRFCWM